MACPHVAGTLALNLAGDLVNTADDLGEPGWDEYYGYGLVDCRGSSYRLRGWRRLALKPLPVVLRDNTSNTMSVGAS